MPTAPGSVELTIRPGTSATVARRRTWNRAADEATPGEWPPGPGNDSLLHMFLWVCMILYLNGQSLCDPPGSCTLIFLLSSSQRVNRLVHSWFIGECHHFWLPTKGYIDSRLFSAHMTLNCLVSAMEHVLVEGSNTSFVLKTRTTLGRSFRHGRYMKIPGLQAWKGQKTITAIAEKCCVPKIFLHAKHTWPSTSATNLCWFMWLHSTHSAIASPYHPKPGLDST